MMGKAKSKDRDRSFQSHSVRSLGTRHPGLSFVLFFFLFLFKRLFLDWLSMQHKD